MSPSFSLSGNNSTPSSIHEVVVALYWIWIWNCYWEASSQVPVLYCWLIDACDSQLLLQRLVLVDVWCSRVEGRKKDNKRRGKRKQGGFFSFFFKYFGCDFVTKGWGLWLRIWFGVEIWNCCWDLRSVVRIWDEIRNNEEIEKILIFLKFVEEEMNEIIWQKRWKERNNE